MLLDMEYYNKFPIVLRTALIKGKVKLPSSIQKQYDNLCVYRAVKYTSTKTTINRNDFLSYVELKEQNPLLAVNDNEISSYGCSCFYKIEEMHIRTKFPCKGKAIAKGIINSKYGPIDINNDTSHIDLYLYDNVDPSNKFEVIEKWEKNG